MGWFQTRRSCSCCASVASVVQSLQRENERLSVALTTQSETLCTLLRKSVDAALTPTHSQIERVLGEQRTEQSGAAGGMDDLPPPPIGMSRAIIDDDPVATIHIPQSSGGYGA